MIFLHVIFWFSAVLMVYSYVVYPQLIRFFSRHKEENNIVYNRDGELPVVCILMSVFNEEKIIERKLQSLANQDYVRGKLFILIGSDGSTDNTETIIKDYAAKNSNMLLFRFNERRGKPGVVNDLSEIAKKYDPLVLILTDANVIFRDDTAFELTKHFKNPQVGLVGANIVNSDTQIDGISKQEKMYIQGENRVKYQEGLIWGTMMGAFGASYAVRKDLFKPVKDNFTVDDFFITMNVLRSGGKAISSPHAICYEDVSNDVREEFRRKKRIAVGNYQNLAEFRSFILHPYTPVGFCFISHKLIRWMGPFFILMLFITSGILATGNKLYLLMFLGQLLMFSTPLIDYVFKKINLHFGLLRFVSYFYLMNMAVLAGFLNYLKGIDSNAWTPTKRNA